MALKVTKNFGKFSVVKDDAWGEFYVVDVANSQAVYSSYWAKHCKHWAEMLEAGTVTVEDMAKYSYASDYLKPLDMPASLKKKQAQLQKQAAHDALQGKPIGSNAPSIVDVVDKGPFKIAKMSDGTYGTLIKATGESKMGMTSMAGASKSGNIAVKKHAASILAQKGIDPGDNATETLIGLYERRVREMYGQAASEMAAKQSKWYEGFAKRQQEMMARLDAGEIAKDEYARWLKGQSAVASQYTGMVESLSADLHAADKRAMQMLNGYLLQAYAENFNFAAYQIDKQAKVATSFDLYNQDAVRQLVMNPEKALLPPVVDEARDMAWCRQKVSSCIAQSILQGESVPHAAQRLQSVVGMGANSAVRAARTALTGASNLGRLEAGQRAVEMGISLKKQWLATVDDRTRHEHRQADRQTVEVDEPFDIGGEDLMYPGDPSGSGEMVWNCRCAMRYVLPGHEYDDIPEVSREGVAYEEWKDAKLAEQEAKAEKLQSQLDAIEAEKGRIQSALPQDESYAAGEILKHDTSLSKWEDEQAAIADSKAYCEKKLSNAKALDDGSGYFADQVKHYEGKLAAIEKFDADGRAYHEAKMAVQGQLDALDAQAKEVGDKLKALKGDKSEIFSQERLDAAHRFKNPKEADNALREISGKAWREATYDERDAINTYTGGAYEYYNRPLNGFKDTYKNYVGPNNLDIDHEAYGKGIRDMTTMIERSVTEEDMWLRRGVSGRTMATFFDMEPGTNLVNMQDDALQALVGTSNRMASFLSCGTTADTGFGGKVNLDIFVPKGSEAFYAEPISRCGRGAGMGWDGISKQSSYGSELETIIQRGGSYTCTGINRAGEKLNITLELHPEDGYWKFQQ